MPTDQEQISAITFYVGKQAIGIPIKNIQEIIEPVPVAHVPLTHAFFSGLIALRGSVVPLIAPKIVFQQVRSTFDPEEEKFVICSSAAGLLAFDVDAIGEPFVFSRDETTAVNNPDTTSCLFPILLARQEEKIRIPDFNRVIETIAQLNSRERA